MKSSMCHHLYSISSLLLVLNKSYYYDWYVFCAISESIQVRLIYLKKHGAQNDIEFSFSLVKHLQTSGQRGGPIYDTPAPSVGNLAVHLASADRLGGSIQVRYNLEVSSSSSLLLVVG